MSTTPVDRIIIITGFFGFMQGIQRFLVPLALISYGWNLAQYTSVFVFQALSMSIPMLFGGVATDIQGRKNTIILGFILSAIGSLLFMITLTGSSIVLIIFAQILSTISFGITRIGLSALMADETIAGFDRTNSLGKQATSRNLGMFFGPLAMGSFLEYGDVLRPQLKTTIASGFFILTIFSIVSISLAFVLPKTTIQQIQKNKEAKISDFSDNQRKMQVAFGFEEIILGFTSGIIVPLIDFYVLTEFNPSTFIWGVVFGLSNSSIALGSFLVGRYSENFGKANSVMFLNGVAPVLALGIALAPTFGLVSVFYVLRSGFANAVQPAWESWYFSHVPDSFRGRSMSVIQISRRMFRAGGVASGPIAFSILGTALFPLACLFYPFAMAIPRQTEIQINKNSKNLDLKIR